MKFDVLVKLGSTSNKHCALSASAAFDLAYEAEDVGCDVEVFESETSRKVTHLRLAAYAVGRRGERADPGHNCWDNMIG